MVYLDPRNDVAFRKVFGTHKRLCISLLNAFLPLPEGAEISDIEYCDPAMLPRTPELKTSIVDVKCKEKSGRTFIVEMQMYWTESFMPRALLNSAKAIAEQTKSGAEFKSLMPVYTLSILNDTFLKGEKYSQQCVHCYSLRHADHPELKIDGLELVFVELPKFRTEDKALNKMAQLWIKYLKDVDGKTSRDQIDPELLANQLTSEAIDLLEKSSFTPEELAAYDRYWDAVSSIRSSLGDAHEQGLEKGRKEGRKEGRKDATMEIAKKMLDSNMSIDQVASITGLDIDTLKSL